MICRDATAKLLPNCRARYNQLCAPGSAVRQCATQTGLPVVSVAEAAKQVRSICDEMQMEGCERCMPAWRQGRAWGPKCDPLAVYGWLCVQMPGEWVGRVGRVGFGWSWCVTWRNVCVAGRRRAPPGAAGRRCWVL
jgi:hypothetical protein